MSALLAGVDGREKGAIPVSVGTSLAIEGACGVYPDRPVSPAPLTQVNEVWFNLRTLIRNLLGCLPSEIKDMVSPPVLLPSLLEELTIIESAIAKASLGMVRVVYYHCDYTPLSRAFPKAILKVPKTPKQQVQHVIEESTLRALLDEHPPHDLRTYRFEIVGNNPTALIVTHLPVDLLARYRFRDLKLLESHTGNIKPHPQWHTKLTNGKELSNIPFNAFSLQVFGDNGNQFSPMLPTIRREVLELANEDNWTSISTPDKIRMSLRKVKDPTTRTTLTACL